MEIIMKRIDEVIPYENNPRINDNAVQYVAESIKQFGFKVPIVIDRDNVIVCGHTRIKAAKELGIEEVPCIIADDLTEEQIKAFRLVDNKVGELSSWDRAALQIELDKINGIQMEDFGFPAVGSMNFDFADTHESVSAPKMVKCPNCGEWFEKDGTK
jgi:ParB/RepB/Spo0J family partition protein